MEIEVNAGINGFDACFWFCSNVMVSLRLIIVVYTIA